MSRPPRGTSRQKSLASSKGRNSRGSRMGKASEHSHSRAGDSDAAEKPVHGVSEGLEVDSCQGQLSSRLKSTSRAMRSGTGNDDAACSTSVASLRCASDQGKKGRGANRVAPAAYSPQGLEEIEEGGGDAHGSIMPSDPASKDKRSRSGSRAGKRTSESRAVGWSDSHGDGAVAAPPRHSGNTQVAQEVGRLRSTSNPRGSKYGDGLLPSKAQGYGGLSDSEMALMREESVSPSATGSRTSSSWRRSSQPLRRPTLPSMSADPSQTESKSRVSRLASKRRQTVRRASVLLQASQDMIFFKDYEEVSGCHGREVGTQLLERE